MSETERTVPAFEIKSLDDIYRVMTIAKGGNPDAQQTLNDFLKFGNNIERTNLPNTTAVLCIGQLAGYGKLLYPDDNDNPFSMIADTLAVAYMARGGDKSKQFVDLMRNTPNLADLQTTFGAEQQRSLADKLFGRGKTE